MAEFPLVRRAVCPYCQQPSPDQYSKMLGLIRAELSRQDEKCGEQTHGLGQWYVVLGEEFGELARRTANMARMWAFGEAVTVEEAKTDEPAGADPRNADPA